MTYRHPDARVQEAIDNLQEYFSHPHSETEIDEGHLPLLIALKDALYATGAYDHEAAIRGAMDINARLYTASRRWSVRLSRWWKGLVWPWRASLVLVLASTTWVSAQPLQFLECAEVNLLGNACDEAAVQDETTRAPSLPAPEPPLFTLQTMRPDTPPLLVNVFNDPSDATIDAFLDWEHRYLSRAFEVEQKLKLRRQRRTASGGR